jgi:putative SOS response-associated peptidase YedK
MTTEPNGIVEPVHEQAMPVMLMTAEDVDRWLKGNSVEEARAIKSPGLAGE